MPYLAFLKTYLSYNFLSNIMSEGKNYYVDISNYNSTDLVNMFCVFFVLFRKFSFFFLLPDFLSLSSPLPTF